MTQKLRSELFWLGLLLGPRFAVVFKAACLTALARERPAIRRLHQGNCMLSNMKRYGRLQGSRPT
jgi:hypothetical protein